MGLWTHLNFSDLQISKARYWPDKAYLCCSCAQKNPFFLEYKRFKPTINFCSHKSNVCSPLLTHRYLLKLDTHWYHVLAHLCCATLCCSSSLMICAIWKAYIQVWEEIFWLVSSMWSLAFYISLHTDSQVHAVSETFSSRASLITCVLETLLHTKNCVANKRVQCRHLEFSRPGGRAERRVGDFVRRRKWIFQGRRSPGTEGRPSFDTTRSLGEKVENAWESLTSPVTKMQGIK